MVGPDSSRRLFPLTSCSIGIWMPVEGMRPYLLLCPDRKQFVVLLAREPDTKARSSNAGSLSVNAVLACARNYAALWLRHKNPFIDHTTEPSDDTAVLTFEVAFSEVVGMDFRWPLTDEPRLVLEAACVCKRVFDSVDEVCAHYPPVRYRRVRGSQQTPSSTAEQQRRQQQHPHNKQQQEQEQGQQAQHLQPKQDQQQERQQQAGSDAGGTAGLMSRAPSWASWASWTIGSVCGSLEGAGTPTAVAAAASASAAAAAGPAAATADAPLQIINTAATEAGAADTAAADGDSQPVACVSAVAQPGLAADTHHSQGKLPAAIALEPLQVPGACSTQRPGHWQGTHGIEQQQQDGGAVVCLTRGRSSSSGEASGADIGPSCALDSMVSLNAGLAGLAPAAAAALAPAAAPASAPSPEDAFSGASHHIGGQLATGGLLQPLLPVRLNHRGARRRRGSTHSSDGGSDLGSLLLSQQHTPGISPAWSGATTPHGVGVDAGGSESGLSEHAALLQGALAEASFGFWQQQHPQQQEEDVSQHSMRCADPAAAGHGGSVRSRGRSMPSSPRALHDVVQGGVFTASAMIEAPRLEQQQQQQEHNQQQQCQHSRPARGAGHGGAVSGRRSSSRSRLAGAADSSCPLCHQALTQPHAVLQQHFHQQLEHRHVRLAAAAAHSKGSKAGTQVARSKSACSLQQLQQLQQQQQERAAADGRGSSSSGSIAGLTLQLPQQGQKQQQRRQRHLAEQASSSPLSPRAFAGVAAAAIGVLAARCKPISSLSSNQGQEQEQGPAVELASSLLVEESLPLGGGAGASTASADLQLQQVLHEDAAAPTSAAASVPVDSHVSSSPQAIGVPTAHAGNSSSSDEHVTTSSRQQSAAAAAGGAAAFADAGSSSCGAGTSDTATEGRRATAIGASPTGVLSPPADAAARVSLGDKAGGVAAAAASDRPAPLILQETLYSNRTVVLTFTDPTLPYQLSKLVKNPSNVHLLKLYESGLPAWAVMLPSYGLWYRPWLRRVTWLLFVLLSVVSMAMGFYDLWKNVPYFKQFVVHMFRPAAAVFEWLEAHTQIRLSILLTYMLGKSQLLMDLVRLLADTSLQPLLAPFAPLAALASTIGEGIAWLLEPFVAAATFVFGPVGRLIWVGLQLLWRFISTVLWFGPLQLLELLGSGFLAFGQVVLLPFQALLPAGASLKASWSAAKATSNVARTAAPAVADAARAAASSGPWWWWSPLEALELMRVSTIRVAKALQAVLRFFVALAATINKHRLSLMMQLKGKLWGGLQAAAASPAGRVASVVAHKMGQGERLMRVQERMARKLSGAESLRSMGSESFAAMGGSFGAVAPDGYAYRPYRTYSIDGDSDIQESQERGDSEDDDGGEVSSSSMRWQQQAGGTNTTATTARHFRSSAGLRQRAVTAAATAAAVAAAAAEGGMNGHLRGGLGVAEQQVLQANPGQHVAGLSAAGRFQPSPSAEDDFLMPPVRNSSHSITAGMHDPVVAAAAARAALSRSYHFPTSSLSGPAAAGSQQVAERALRQSYERLATAMAAAQGAALAASPEAPSWPTSAGGALDHRPEGQSRPSLQQQHQHQASFGRVGWTEAAGLLMLPERDCIRPLL